ncbi:hypothetical protein D3C71_999570 [compost metagenome]
MRRRWRRRSVSACRRMSKWPCRSGPPPRGRCRPRWRCRWVRTSATCWPKAPRTTASAVGWCWPLHWPSARCSATAWTRWCCTVKPKVRRWKTSCWRTRSTRSARSSYSTANTCPTRTVPVRCTPPPATARKTTWSARSTACWTSTTPVRSPRSTAVASTWNRPRRPATWCWLASTCGRRRRRSCRCCVTAAHCWPSSRSATATRTAGGTRRRWCSAPPRSGSSRWTRPTCATMRWPPSTPSAGSRAGARRASRAWSTAARTGRSRASAPGACRSHCSPTARQARSTRVRWS